MYRLDKTSVFYSFSFFLLTVFSITVLARIVFAEFDLETNSSDLALRDLYIWLRIGILFSILLHLKTVYKKIHNNAVETQRAYRVYGKACLAGILFIIALRLLDIGILSNGEVQYFSFFVMASPDPDYFLGYSKFF